MNPDKKKQWTTALRSGEYEQGEVRLERDGKFCCLGVLSHLAYKEGVVTRKPSTTHDEDGDTYAYGEIPNVDEQGNSEE
jgi:hypothetical protein